MNKTNAIKSTPASGRRPLTLLADSRPAARDAALRRARDARRALAPRAERFAHLKRTYD